MCNRFRSDAAKAALAGAMQAQLRLEYDRLPEPELFPRRLAWVAREDDGRRILDTIAWGIPVNMRGKRPGSTITNWITNVRNLSSPFWRPALADPARRCLVPFTSFAEPKPGKDDEGRPACWWFDLPGQAIGAFAGIWRPYTVQHKGEPLSGVGFAFLTCDPNPLVAPLHPKAMPVILHPEDYDRWLSADYDEACALASPYPSQLMAVA